MKRLTQTFSHVVHGFACVLNTCLLSLALTFFLVATSVALSKGLSYFG
ncbi:MAG: hypothetical protein JST04_06800 [Bdellovibrionales bacterium]|nr:hypothetical protein [Bdellovibrionales bacterium]